MSSNPIYIVTDLDGTLVRIERRVKYASYLNGKGQPRLDYTKFYDATKILELDEPRMEVINAIKEKQKEYPDAILVLSSGRSSGTDVRYEPGTICTHTGGNPIKYNDRTIVNRNAIVDYMANHFDLHFGVVMMRAYNDFTPDEELKLRWLNENLGGADNVICWWDDRPRVCTALKNAGVNLIDVGEPEITHTSKF